MVPCTAAITTAPSSTNAFASPDSNDSMSQCLTPTAPSSGRRSNTVNSGKGFEYELARSLTHFGETHPGFFWRRWPDFQDFSREAKYHAPRAPSDFIALYRGTFTAIEAKSTRGTRFRMDWLKPHQRRSLLDVKVAGGISYLAFNHRSRPFRCWLIDISDYLRLEKEFSSDGMKSVPIAAISKIGKEVSRINIKNEGMTRGAKGWRLSPVLELRESLTSYNSGEKP